MQPRQLLTFFLLVTAINSFSQNKTNSNPQFIPDIRPNSEFTAHRFKLITETPVMYGLGYEFQFHKKLSTTLQFGLLTEPNSSLILSVMEKLGTDEVVIDLLKNSFRSGKVFDIGFNYNWGNYYAGIFGQHIGLKANDTPIKLLETAMGVDASTYPIRGNGTALNNLSNSNNTIELKSYLIQAGFLFGRRFNLKNSWELNAEIAISKNWYSSSDIYSSKRDFAALNQELNTFLQEIYWDYSYVPSANIGVAFNW